MHVTSMWSGFEVTIFRKKVFLNSGKGLRPGFWYLAPFSSTVCVSYILSRVKNFAILTTVGCQ